LLRESELPCEGDVVGYINVDQSGNEDAEVECTVESIGDRGWDTAWSITLSVN